MFANDPAASGHHPGSCCGVAAPRCTVAIVVMSDPHVSSMHIFTPSDRHRSRARRSADSPPRVRSFWGRRGGVAPVEVVGEAPVRGVV